MTTSEQGTDMKQSQIDRRKRKRELRQAKWNIKVGLAYCFVSMILIFGSIIFVKDEKAAAWISLAAVVFVFCGFVSANDFPFARFIPGAMRVIPNFQHGDYLDRVFVLPNNPIFAVYLHIWRGDDPDYYHDHPAASISFLLRGTLWESVKDGRNRALIAPSINYRPASWAHRIKPIIFKGGGYPITLFVFLPRFRQWGFFCKKGWKRGYDVIKNGGC